MRRAGLLAVGMVALLLWGPTLAQTDKSKRPAGKGDIELVERLIASRREYQLILETLRIHYMTGGDVERARWAEEELRAFHLMPKYAFRLELDVPPPTLRGDTNIPEANELYRQAKRYKDQGWRSSDYLANQHRAELLFQQLLTNYPQSDKISDTAYMLGDIYESKAFHQADRAAAYFERCFQWNTKTQFDARMRAARLYEGLNERTKAIEIYKLITNHETDAKRVEEAQKRLTVLQAQK